MAMTEQDFRELVRREARGEAMEEEAAFLREESMRRRWKETLEAMVVELDAEFSSKAAESRKFKQKCRAEGRAGKRRWFAYKEDYDIWHAESSVLKSALQARISEARRLCGGPHRGGERQGALPPGLSMLLARVEAHLAGMQEEVSNPERGALLEEVRTTIEAGNNGEGGSRR